LDGGVRRHAGGWINVEERITFVRHFQLESQQSKSLFGFGLDHVAALIWPFGVEPVKAGFVDFQIGVIDQEWFREYALAVDATAIEQIERAVARVELGESRRRWTGGGAIRQCRTGRHQHDKRGENRRDLNGLHDRQTSFLHKESYCNDIETQSQLIELTKIKKFRGGEFHMGI